MKEKKSVRAQAQYTDYVVREPMELMQFLAAKMPQASRTKLKTLLSKRVVFVNHVITTQYNFSLQPGMKVQISRERGKKEFHNKLLKIVYEDAYLIVVEKMQGLLSVSTERQKERTACTILNEYLKRSAGVGVRIFLPMIGMMGIDWAYGFDKVFGSKEYGGSQFHFILGQEF